MSRERERERERERARERERESKLFFFFFFGIKAAALLDGVIHVSNEQVDSLLAYLYNLFSFFFFLLNTSCESSVGIVNNMAPTMKNCGRKCFYDHYLSSSALVFLIFH